MNSSDYRAFNMTPLSFILILLSFCKKETISITVISVTFRDGNDVTARTVAVQMYAYPSTFTCDKSRVCW